MYFLELYAENVPNEKQALNYGKGWIMNSKYANIQILKTKLAVRSCQYEIAVEGLKTIVESNDPMGVAEKTLKAMEECLP